MYLVILGLRDGKDIGIWALCSGTLGHIRDVPRGMGRTVEIGHCAVGHLGHVWDVPSNPGSLGWEGQRDTGTVQTDILG